ncbi:hypothetical protein [Salinicoccus albus]|uniref:hypothetical protein n=1 Tax=Salinicoccus albus TaxID=418756 RepID=UPI000372C8E7|nr:hypothetical protein [Salinicoccus albus]
MCIGLFDFFKKDAGPEDTASGEKYWSLTTNEGEVREPAWEQVEEAVQHAWPDEQIFASLGCMNADLEIEIIQVIGMDDGSYWIEALPPKGSYDYGKIFVNNTGLNYDDTIKRVKEFYDHQSVADYRSWDTETI